MYECECILEYIYRTNSQNVVAEQIVPATVRHRTLCLKRMFVHKFFVQKVWMKWVWWYITVSVIYWFSFILLLMYTNIYSYIILSSFFIFIACKRTTLTWAPRWCHRLAEQHDFLNLFSHSRVFKCRTLFFGASCLLQWTNSSEWCPSVERKATLWCAGLMWCVHGLNCVTVLGYPKYTKIWYFNLI